MKTLIETIKEFHEKMKLEYEYYREEARDYELSMNIHQQKADRAYDQIELCEDALSSLDA